MIVIAEIIRIHRNELFKNRQKLFQHSGLFQKATQDLSFGYYRGLF